jgi:ankyrin repeat protein
MIINLAFSPHGLILNQVGRSALYWAAREGHEPVVAKLLQDKADVNTAIKVSYCDAFYCVFK